VTHSIDTDVEFELGTNRRDDVRLGGGDDAYDGRGGNDRVRGGRGDDVLFGGNGHDRLFGQSGDDILEGGGGDDYFYGGAGSDTVLYTANTRTVEIDLENGRARFLSQSSRPELLQSIENAIAGSGNDILRGNAAANLFIGGGGNDTFEGREGDDTFDGGPGDDTFNGGSGSDTVIYEENTRTVRVNLVEQTVSFTGQRAPSENMRSIENAVTGSGEDTLIGNDQNNRLSAGDGDDRLTGGHGRDRILGGDGDDVLEGGGDQDFLNGGAGQDTAVYRYNYWDFPSEQDEPFSLNIDLSSNRVTFTRFDNGGYASETIISIENITAGDGDDRIFGDEQANVIRAGGGINEVRGGGGDDVIHGSRDCYGAEWTNDVFEWEQHGSHEYYGDYLDGGSGDDTIYSQGSYNIYQEMRFHNEEGYEFVLGGGGNDEIHAGYGDLYLSGGSGADEFHFSDDLVELGDLGRPAGYFGESATITDFDRSEGDRIFIDVADPDQFEFVGGEPSQPFEWSFSADGDDTVVHLGLANASDLDSSYEDYIVTAEIRLQGYEDGLAERDFLFV
jgi:Ca2+-binding RTX toxin-like protein